MKRNVDYLIIGQGLVGSILAWFLHKRNKSFVIIDELKGEPSSRQATGLINPITGRRFVKSWKIDELLPFAEKTYNDIEQKLNCSLLSKTKVHRILQSVEQQNDWASKLDDKRYQNYLQNRQLIFHKNKGIINPLGCIEIKPVLRINTPKLVDELATFLDIDSHIIREKLNYDKLKINEKSITYNDIKASKIIFCEGYNAINNPFFKELPFVLSKGEVLNIEAKELPEDFIIGGNTNIAPLGKHTFYVGATNAWDDVSLITTQNKKDELIQKLEAIIDCKYKIIKQKVGVRPTVKDRRPLLGTHTIHKNMFILNGMGTKGLSLAPYFAQHLIEHIENGEALDPEVNIERFS